jgi:acyl-CoA synthetase (AMP-forming)/AMP-acid ligase II
MSRLDDILKSSARRWGSRPAIAWEDHVFTYRQLDERVDDLARRLASSVSAHQRVGVLAPNAPSMVIGMFAVWRIGAVAVLLNVRWREYELGSILKDAEITALVCSEKHGSYSFADLASRLSGNLPTLGRVLLIDSLGNVHGETTGSATGTCSPCESDIGVIHYTSGTTGQPKGVMLYENTPANGGTALAEILHAESSDVVMLVLPLAHAFGLLTLLSTLIVGSLGVLVGSTFSLAHVLEAKHRHAVNVVHGSPTLFESLLKSSPDELASIRTGLVGGTICAARLIEDLENAGLKILNSYGMTEFGPATSCRMDDPSAVRYQTVGRPLPGNEFRIVDGPEGQVQVKSHHIMAGYFHQSELTSASFDGDWFRTGDIGSIDAEGNLRISGRTSEVIHVAGLKVFPAEVEGCLLTHPHVAEAVVVGIPHETMGEAPAAFVVLQPDAHIKPNQLLQFARRSIAGYKLPYLIRVVPSLPRLATGKPDRVTLARCLEEESNAESNARSQSTV